MAGGKPDVTELGYVASPSAKPSFGRRVAAHYKRWWWVHVIVIIAVVLLITLPLTYVGYPRIAQGDINDSTLDITEMIISNPTPQGLTLNLTQALGSHSIFKPTIYAFEAAVTVVGAASSFAHLHVPQTKARDGTLVHVDQHLDLSDPDAFAGFSKAVMLNDELKLNVYGEPDLKEGGLPKIGIKYNKTVTLKALNKLEGFAIQEMHLLNGKSGDGPNMGGTVFIPNPSIMTIAMGNVTLDLAVNGTSIGTSYLDDLVIVPGDNHHPMTSKIDLGAVIKFLSAYPDGLPVAITGNPTNSSVYNEQPIPYFSQALASNELNVKLDLAKLMTDQ
ncbi:DUF3712 domain-containing protein [Aspergillus clavatus NRRL 1]|uniref:Uncharacterized protein n=1 Tax=Aspergillus clavatus (strain ATCC 1007 / CBS 513.65 / DSM 816 / NCTC 3887 / NRRL 1 / QM 1276 / 107) TaxID=344612 RepID=A1CS12_ASPCL|nr:uncharacterized protein ACLA_031660 [Aspergillus clavatus NRRL 1]EAW08433.1 conserved hypothetical protein [Aspergillus clavatus NRRL 1]